MKSQLIKILYTSFIKAKIETLEANPTPLPIANTQLSLCLRAFFYWVFS